MRQEVKVIDGGLDGAGLPDKAVKAPDVLGASQQVGDPVQRPAPGLHGGGRDILPGHDVVEGHGPHGGQIQQRLVGAYRNPGGGAQIDVSTVGLGYDAGPVGGHGPVPTAHHHRGTD